MLASKLEFLKKDLSDDQETARTRALTIALTGTAIIAAYLALQGIDWRGSAYLHTSMEVAATLLAGIVGAMAMLRYFAIKQTIFLFVAAGFLGTSFLDIYHAIVTSAAVRPYMPSDLPALIPWSWVASRQFLSVFLFLSWLAWWKTERKNEVCKIDQRNIFYLTGIFSLLTAIFFSFAPLPRAYYPELFFHRPEELLPAVFFVATFVGYLKKGDWRHNVFDFWLVLSLVTAIGGQAVFMSFSGSLFDMEFDVAHLIKIISYSCVLVGLMANMLSTFRYEAVSRQVIQDARLKAETSLSELAAQKRAMDEHAIVAVTDVSGTITYVNDKFSKISGYSRKELIGANHRLLNSGCHKNSFFEKMYQTISSGQPWHGKIKNRAKDGSIYWVDTTIMPITSADGTITQYIAIRADITKLKLVQTELKAHRDQLEEMVDEATRALWTKTEELEKALTKEKELGELQRQFVTMASHEFRTPLAIIDSTAQRLKSRAGKNRLTPEDAIKRVEKIRDAVQRMTRLMESTLSMARVDNGKIEIDIKPCNVIEIIKRVCARQKELSSSHTITCDLAELPQSLPADAGALEQIFTNLVSNAVKYSPEASDIQLSSKCCENEVKITIRDHGIGIDEDDLPRIGERFFRARTSTGIEGTGIGLSLVSHLLERHHGKLAVSSTRGEGSAFTIHLPRTGAPVKKPAAKKPRAAQQGHP